MRRMLELVRTWVWARRERRAKDWLTRAPLVNRRRSTGIRIDGPRARVRWSLRGVQPPTLSIFPGD